MDYIFVSSILYTKLLLIIISYNITCQWFINLMKRMDQHWPLELHINSAVTLCLQIPKLHEPGHQRVGHKEFSFKYARGGRNDGR